MPWAFGLNFRAEVCALAIEEADVTLLVTTVHCAMCLGGAFLQKSTFLFLSPCLV